MGGTYRDIDIYKTWALEGTLNFTRYFFRHRFGRRFVVGQHHVRIAAMLDRILRGELTRVIFNVAPRYEELHRHGIRTEPEGQVHTPVLFR